MKNVITLIIIVLTIIVGLFFYIKKYLGSDISMITYQAPNDTQNNATSTNPTINFNFERTGSLIKDNPGLEKNIWYLIYETPGSPASMVKMSFDNNSICKTADKVEICNPDKLKQGD